MTNFTNATPAALATALAAAAEWLHQVEEMADIQGANTPGELLAGWQENHAISTNLLEEFGGDDPEEALARATEMRERVETIRRRGMDLEDVSEMAAELEIAQEAADRLDVFIGDLDSEVERLKEETEELDQIREDLGHPYNLRGDISEMLVALARIADEMELEDGDRDPITVAQTMTQSYQAASGWAAALDQIGRRIGLGLLDRLYPESAEMIAATVAEVCVDARDDRAARIRAEEERDAATRRAEAAEAKLAKLPAFIRNRL